MTGFENCVENCFGNPDVIVIAVVLLSALFETLRSLNLIIYKLRSLQRSATGGATVVAPAAPQPEVQGWSTFEEPAASTSAPAASTESSASGAFHGWQAFDTAQPSVPSGPSAVEPVASRGPVMKELPSVSPATTFPLTR